MCELLRFVKHLFAAGVIFFIVLLAMEFFDICDDFDENV